MNMLMLAEIDLSGIFCLAAIPCLIVVLYVYRKGLIIGGCTCLALLSIAVYITCGAFSTPFKEVREHGFTNDVIANLHKTKFMKMSECITSSSYRCIYRKNAADPYFKDQDHNRDYNIKIPASLDNYAVFIPEKEMYIIGGSLFMHSTDEPPVANDYYLYDETYDEKAYNNKADVIPKWLYHPAAPVLIFGAGAIPGLLVMGAVVSFLNKK